MGYTQKTMASTLRVDDFTMHYIATGLSLADEDAGRNVFADDLAPESLAKIKQECADFQAANPSVSENSAIAGQDFWLTRNRHGAGFWDGDWEDGDALTQAAHACGERNLILGDDGKLHYES